MKKILFISATSNTNLTLAKELSKNINLKLFNIKIMNLEKYNLPIYNPSSFIKDKKDHIDTISKLTNIIVSADAFVVCAPEYNGNVPPVLTNAIAWISSMTDYWKDAFKNKHIFIASSSGGDAKRFKIAIKNQLMHIGCIVFEKTIIINSNSKLDHKLAKKYINEFIKLL